MSSTLLKGNPIGGDPFRAGLDPEGGGPILGPSLKFVIKSHLNYSTPAGLDPF